MLFAMTESERRQSLSNALWNRDRLSSEIYLSLHHLFLK